MRAGCSVLIRVRSQVQLLLAPLELPFGDFLNPLEVGKPSAGFVLLGLDSESRRRRWEPFGRHRHFDAVSALARSIGHGRIPADDCERVGRSGCHVAR